MARAFGVWALLNPDDAELFEGMIADPALPVATVLRVAREAAVHDSFQGDAGIADLFGAAVRPDGKAAARWHFRDGAAPQFLLAKFAAQHGGEADAPPAAIHCA